MSAGSYCKRIPWGSQKPPLGSQIEWSSSFAKNIRVCYLANDQSGMLLSDVGNNKKALQLVSPSKFTARGMQTDWTGTCSTVAAVPAGDALDITGQISIVVNFYLEQLPGGGGFFNLAGAGYSTRVPYGLDYRNAGTIKLWGGTYTAAKLNTNVEYTVSLALGIRHQAAIVNDGSYWRLYLNGREVGTPYADTTGALTTDARRFGVGCMDVAGNLSRIIRGAIDNCVIYDIGLQATTIAALYEQPYQMIEGWNYGRFFSVPSGVVYYGSLIGDSALIGNGVLIGGYMQ